MAPIHHPSQMRDWELLFQDYHSQPSEANLCGKFRSGTGALPKLQAHMHPEAPDVSDNETLAHISAESARFRQHEVSGSKLRICKMSVLLLAGAGISSTVGAEAAPNPRPLPAL